MCIRDSPPPRILSSLDPRGDHARIIQHEEVSAPQESRKVLESAVLGFLPPGTLSLIHSPPVSFLPLTLAAITRESFNTRRSPLRKSPERSWNLRCWGSSHPGPCLLYTAPPYPFFP